jgi:hypothetical protein
MVAPGLADRLTGLALGFGGDGAGIEDDAVPAAIAVQMRANNLRLKRV